MADEPIPAATLIVVRDLADGNPQLLMVERSQGMAFAAGAMVFPGGRIDPADDVLAAATGTSAAAIAAIRETIEETAIPVGLAPVPSPVQARGLQAALAAGRSFADALADGGFAIDAGALVPLARWVPQFHAVRRFDTLFFVTSAPPGDWMPVVDTGECARAEWVPAAEVLRRDGDARARLIFPTRRTLERIAQHSSFEAIRADAIAHPLEPITPWVEQRGGESFVMIPSHLGFPVTQERLDGLWRG